MEGGDRRGQRRQVPVHGVYRRAARRDERHKVADLDLVGGRVTTERHEERQRPCGAAVGAGEGDRKRRAAGKKPEDLLFDHCVDARKTIARIIEQSGAAFSPHDCRRTFSAMAANLLPELVLKCLLNHAVGDDVTAGHYVHFSEADLRGAVQRVADYLTKKSSQRPPKRGEEKVVPIRAAPPTLKARPRCLDFCPSPDCWFFFHCAPSSNVHTRVIHKTSCPPMKIYPQQIVDKMCISCEPLQ
ncbi:MAG TPA: hypothetical protein VJV79_30700 [Polyangiaceae bacterium]|nr:hypothetical protein [Polyangiaceae bacterium]